MMPHLVVQPGSPACQDYPLQPGRTTLGRGDDNDIVIADPSVSTHHCQIIIDSGRVLIRDLGSTNGTFLNRAPVSEAPLAPGQQIHLGNVELALKTEATPTALPGGRSTEEVIDLSHLVTLVSAPAGSSDTVVQTAPPVASTPAPAPATIVVRAIPKAAKPPGSVRVATAPAPSPAVPPAIPPVATPALPTPASAHCYSHPKSPAHFQCTQCRHGYCDLCVSTRSEHGVFKRYCRRCGGECITLEVKTAPVQAPRGFFPQVRGAFLYPFKGTGVMVLIAATIVFAALNAFARIGMHWGLIIKVIATGYLFSYMQNIVQSTAVQDEEMPPLPSMADMWQDVLLPCLQLVGLTLIAFGPAIGLTALAAAMESSAMGVLIVPAFLFGCLYAPMAFLAVGILDTIAAANPLQVIPSALRVKKEYAMCLLVLGLALAVRWGSQLLIGLAFPKGVLTYDTTTLLLMFFSYSFSFFLSIYLLTVCVRILGLLYVSKKRELAWLDH
jgi:hypothetical protein